jgi:membrane protein
VTSVASLPPIPGEPIDPPPKAPPETVQGLDEADGVASTAVGVGYRALTRFNEARATLLAAGTTYYVFLAMFSLIALGYGITALFGADKIASYLTQAIAEAFPGLLGEEGIDPAELRSIGQAASIVGLVAMLYAGSGAMVAANSSIHLIYGAPKDPRNYALKRVRMLGMLVILGSLIAFSFVAGTFTVRFSDRILTTVGLGTTPEHIFWTLAGVVVTLATDFLIVYLILGRLGGIRPPRRAHLIGATVGAFVIQILRIPMALILEFSANKPQYGALAIPIGVLLVLYLNSITVYGAAALTAGIAERDVPLEEIAPAIETAEAQPEAD